MDILCVKCGEPWDLDSLHDETVRRGYGAFDDVTSPWYSTVVYEETFNKVRNDFYKKGCIVLDGQCSESRANDSIGIIYDLLGDDIDGAASAFEDFM